MWKNPNPDFIDDFICGGSKCLSRSESGLEQTNLCSVASDQCRWIGDYTAIYPAIVCSGSKRDTRISGKAAQQYRGQPTYFYFNLGHELKELPPKVPEQASLLGTILWSLKFRFYAWQQQQGSDPSSNVTSF